MEFLWVQDLNGLVHSSFHLIIFINSSMTEEGYHHRLAKIISN